MGKVQNCFSSLRDLTVDFSAMGYYGCQTSTRVKKSNQTILVGRKRKICQRLFSLKSVALISAES